MVRKRILIVVDDPGLDWAADILQEGKSSPDCRLLTFGFAPEQAFLKYRARAEELKARVTIVDTREVSRISEKEARGHYLKFIRELPGRKTSSGDSIMDVLSYRGRNLWWYLGITEKSIWLDKLIHYLYSLQRFHRVFEEGAYNEVRLCLRDDVLHEVISGLIREKGVGCLTVRNSMYGKWLGKGSASFIVSYVLLICRECVKLLLKIVTLRLAGVSSKSFPKDGSVGFFSIYPVWWKYPFSKGATDLIFQNVALELEREKPVRYLLWLIPGHVLLRNRKGFEAFAGKRRVFILDSLLGVFDILSVLDPRLFMKLLKAFRIACRSAHEMAGIDISPLAREDLFRSFTSPMFFQCLLLDQCLQRVTMENLETLFFRLEFQPLERALLYNTHGKTNTVGFQHSALGKNFLNYVFEDGELRIHGNNQDDSDSMPLPDYILTSGGKGVEYLRQSGYPPERLAVGGAVRLGPLYSYRENTPPRQKLRQQYGIPADKKVIFVATSPLLQETICMLSDMFDAVKSDSDRFHLVIKCHPNAHAVPGYIRRVRGMMDSRRSDVSLDFYTEPIAFYDYISLSDAVLLTGGTVALEAMLLGCVPIIYVNDAQFSHNPMTEYPEAVILVDGRESMEEALKIINDREAVEKLKRNWEKPLHDMFYDGEQNPNKRFIHVLKNDFRIL